MFRNLAIAVLGLWLFPSTIAAQNLDSACGQAGKKFLETMETAQNSPDPMHEIGLIIDSVDFAQIIAICERGFKGRSNEGEARFIYGVALLRAKKIAEATVVLDSLSSENLYLIVIVAEYLKSRFEFEPAIKLLRSAADKGNAHAHLLIGTWLFSGVGGTKEPSASLKHFLHAAEKGIREAQVVLGLVLGVRRIGVIYDPIEAFKWLALSQVGPAGIPLERVELIALKFKLADDLTKEQLAKAQYQILRTFERMHGSVAFLPQIPKGYALPPVALSDKDPPITNCDRVSSVYFDERRVVLNAIEGDKSSAVEACKTALAKYPNSARLIFQYGAALFSASDEEGGLVQVRRAAELNYPAAHIWLGDSYKEGDIGKANPEKALRHYRKASKLGSLLARCRIGEEQMGDKTSNKGAYESVTHCLPAAHAGIPTAQHSIAGSHRYGLGVPKSLTRAYAWYDLASANARRLYGEENNISEGERELVGSEMAPDELLQAKNLAKSWRDAWNRKFPGRRLK